MNVDNKNYKKLLPLIQGDVDAKIPAVVKLHDAIEKMDGASDHVIVDLDDDDEEFMIVYLTMMRLDKKILEEAISIGIAIDNFKSMVMDLINDLGIRALRCVKCNSLNVDADDQDDAFINDDLIKLKCDDCGAIFYQ